VTYEAARAICSLRNVTPKELTPAITVLQLFLSSPKAALRFAAVRTLNKVAQTHPLSVTTCNLDMENLITDSNRSIATLAITTLLKVRRERKKTIHLQTFHFFFLSCFPFLICLFVCSLKLFSWNEIDGERDECGKIDEADYQLYE
jgi:hypothetical protein